MDNVICFQCASHSPATSHFCATCGAALVSAAIAETRIVPPQSGSAIVQSESPADQVTHGTASAHADSFDVRLVPGEVLGGRYRIVGVLGKGGMGIVCRADDLVLDQAVALKFISHRFAREPERVARFRNEVRVARQISHPYVCRVYDIGESGDDLFLSMEFVEGEDLAALLSKVGRLPEERAHAMARQLCQGLAAAHERGVIHRDIKPQNILLDRRGNVRITDFGLAGFVGKFREDELRDGTPLYMSPEQLAGRDVTVRSDLFSLGLVLYELYTGKVAFPARGVRGWSPGKADWMPDPPSVHVSQLSTAVNRVILRCLASDPDDRPPSAQAVLQELPGGDPLQAALTAGDTPAPELVADAAWCHVLPRRTAAGLFVVAMIGLTAALVLGTRTSILSRTELREPAVLAHQARAAMKALGCADSSPSPGDRAFRFSQVPDSDREVGGADSVTNSDALEFWYRESPLPLVPTRSFTHVATPDDPPRSLPGMVLVLLNGAGELKRFETIPMSQQVTTQPEAVDLQHWRRVVSELTGRDLSAWSEAESDRVPPVFAEQRVVWRCPADLPDERYERVEVAFFRGKPINVEVVPASASQQTAATGSVAPRVTLLSLMFGLSLYASVSYLAWRNLRLERGDRRGAFRLALFVFAIEMFSWLMQSLDPSAGSVFLRTFAVVLENVSGAFLIWLLYIAVEPEVRRRWPHVMVTWCRVLMGRVGDATLGRSILLGVVSGVVFVLFGQTLILLPHWLPLTPPPPLLLADSGLLLGLGPAIGTILSGIFLTAIVSSMLTLTVLLLLQVILRRQGLAAIVLAAIVICLGFGSSEPSLMAWLRVAVLSCVTVALLVRVDLVASIAFAATVSIQSFPLTADFSVWYANSGLLAVAVIAALAVWGYWNSVGKNA